MNVKPIEWQYYGRMSEGTVGGQVMFTVRPASPSGYAAGSHLDALAKALGEGTWQTADTAQQACAKAWREYVASLVG